MFCISLGHFIPVLLAFVVLSLVSLVPSQELAGKNISKKTYSVSSGI